ncbi:MAG TPA: hybrid sensor histidine kinase/response regulator [Candidatus Binatia bacterium]|jgi:two-component system chemotaxis sensor kinase CheA|nr:hybrid sensor histidine kinase/response regulator [Candidatus Binatia bacterium]
MIEDVEFRSLFKTESQEYLQRLDEHLLSLEKNPADQAILEEAFRLAHSLKGSARMLGVTSVEAIAHRFEDTLDSARLGTTVLSSEIVDRMYGALDAIRELVHEAVTGEPVSVNLTAVLHQLDGENMLAPDAERLHFAPASGQLHTADENAAPPATRKLEELVPAGRAETAPMAERPAAAASAAVGHEESHRKADEARIDRPQDRFTIDTVRVNPQQLDDLMTLIGELTVTKIQMVRGLTELEAIVTLWEEWQRDLVVNRWLPAEAGPRTTLAVERNGPQPVGKRVWEFLERNRDRLERSGALLGRLLQMTHEDQARLEFVANGLEESIRSIRLLPLSTIFNLFPRMVRDLARQQSKEIQFLVEGGDTTADKRILEELKDPLMHLIRNAIDHGLETPDERQRQGKPREGSLWLRAYQLATSIVIELRDDGRGLDLEAIKQKALQRKICGPETLETMTPEQVQALIFMPGFSTAQFVTDLSGRGVGLDVVRTTVENLKGAVQVESVRGTGCTFCLTLPATLATARVLITQVSQRPYAIPVQFVEQCRSVSSAEIFPIEGRETISHEGQPVSVARLADLLELNPGRLAVTVPEAPAEADARKWPCVFLTFGKERLGVLVDGLDNEQEVVLKPFGPLLRRVRNVYGATILGSGDVCMILNPQDLLKSYRKMGERGVAEPTEAKSQETRKLVILLAEDSITTRTQEKRILETAGYEVVAAVDGLDALNKLGTHQFDAVVSDVQMPNLDGLSLTAKIRQDKKYKELPIILVTALASDADRRRGLEVGANAYITKPTFDRNLLLATLQQLI